MSVEGIALGQTAKTASPCDSKGSKVHEVIRSWPAGRRGGGLEPEPKPDKGPIKIARFWE